MWPQLTSHGAPFPLVVFSFDDVLANTALNFHEAGVRFARKYLGGTCMVPSLDEFRRVHDFDDHSVL